MKNKKIIRLFTAMLAVVLCTTAFAVPAFAGGGEGEPYYTETAGTEADPAEDAEAPEVTITDEEDPAGDDSADNNTEADGDTLDQITELLGGLGTVTVTEDGILFTPDTEKWETQQTGTVTTCGGNLNVRTGAGLDNDAFTQLPDGAQVEVIGTEGEWVKVLLPEREGYVHSDYLTITDEDFVVIMTSGHVRDFQVEEQTLRGPFAYVGVIGSRRKTASVNQRLLEAGIPQSSIDLVHTPIGTPILAVTPEEIAVSIAGEMIRVRAQRRGPTSHGCPMHG